MKRRELLKKIGAGTAVALGGRVLGLPYVHEETTSGTRPPNILFIMSDQHRFDALGAHGSKYMHTPNLDKLCREGVRFTNTYAAQAVCSPSRASIFSGLYPHTHLVQDNIYGQPDVTSMPQYHMSVTWPLLLQRAGYHTGYIGKWHLGEQAPKCFDEWKGFNSGKSHWLGKSYNSQYRPDWETEQGLDFIKRNKNKPFVLCQSYYPPHTPYTAPKEYWKYYEKGVPDGRPMEYYAAVSDIDMNVGRLIRQLDDLDLLDKTLIIYTSDHGDAFGTRPGGGNKRSAYDESARVPLIIRYPHIFEGGKVPEHLVSNVDIMPTILEVAGIKIPDNLQGRSLVGVMKSKTEDWRTAVCIENREDLDKGGDRSRNANSRGVRTKTHKLILRDKLSIRAKTTRELYDMIKDAGEQKNIYGREQISVIAPILNWLENWSRATSDDVGLHLVQTCRADIGAQ